nr:matrix protein [Infectious hematopoietic necrosis virus]
MSIFKRAKRTVLIPPPHLLSGDEERVTILSAEGEIKVTGKRPTTLEEKIYYSMNLAAAIVGGDLHPSFKSMTFLFQKEMEFGSTQEKVNFGSRKPAPQTTYQVMKAREVYLQTQPLEKKIPMQTYSVSTEGATINFTGRFLFSSSHVGCDDNRTKLAGLDGFTTSNSYQRVKDYYAQETALALTFAAPEKRGKEK